MASPGTMSLTLQQPLNNIARLAIQMLACALGGGGQAMTTPLHDEAHALPSEEAIAVGAAMQNIVAHESGVADTVDPLAGSYYVEVMTRRIEDAVMAEIEKIDAMGGALAAIQRGYFQRELAREQVERNRELETGARVLVGAEPSRARGAQARDRDLFRLDPESERRQIERLARVRAQRDAGKVAEALERVREAAERGENLVPPVLDAVKVYASGGEICDALREVFGSYTPDSLTPGSSVARMAERPLRVLLAKLGLDSHTIGVTVIAQGAARRRHGGDLQRPQADARDGGVDGDPGGRRRGRRVEPLGGAHAAHPARRGAAARARAPATSW